MQVKKNKKKNKSEVKQIHHVFTDDGKEPDDGKQTITARLIRTHKPLKRMEDSTPKLKQ